jgi:hypothetical protein
MYQRSDLVFGERDFFQPTETHPGKIGNVCFHKCIDENRRLPSPRSRVTHTCTQRWWVRTLPGETSWGVTERIFLLLPSWMYITSYNETESHNSLSLFLSLCWWLSHNFPESRRNITQHNRWHSKTSESSVSVFHILVQWQYQIELQRQGDFRVQKKQINQEYWGRMSTNFESLMSSSDDQCWDGSSRIGFRDWTFVISTW